MTSIYDMHVSLAAMRADAEQIIIQNVCANSRAAVFILDDHGITTDCFDQADFAAIFGAVRLHARHEKIVQVRTCRRLLQAIGHWDATDTRSFISGSWWSNEKLAALFSQSTYDSETLWLATAELLFCVAVARKADLAREAERKAAA